MILSSSTFRFLTLASLAASGMSSSIRGRQTENSELSQDKRNLVEIDMSIGLGKMACEEHPVDGSVVCTFRTTPPADLNTGRMVYDCLTGFCLSTEVNRIPFNEVPKEDTQVIDVPPQKPSQPVNPYPVGSVGTCPARQQNTGVGCSQFIPNGQTSTVCLYGQTRCECKLQENNPAIAVGWNCFVVQPTTLPEVPDPVVLPAPTVAPRPVVLPNPEGPPASNAFSEVSPIHTESPSILFSAASFQQQIKFHNNVTLQLIFLSYLSICINQHQFQCRPLLFGCVAPHTLLSDCSGDPACCPGNILEDWRTKGNTCKHGSNTGLPVPRPVPNPVPNIDATIVSTLLSSYEILNRMRPISLQCCFFANKICSLILLLWTHKTIELCSCSLPSTIPGSRQQRNRARRDFQCSGLPSGSSKCWRRLHLGTALFLLHNGRCWKSNWSHRLRLHQV